MTNSNRAVVLAFAIALGLWFAYTARNALLLIYVSVVFAVVLTPAVERIMKIRIGRWRPSRGLAVAIIVLGTLIAVVIFFAFALPPIIGDFRELTKELPSKIDAWRTRAQRLPFGSDFRFQDMEKHLGELIGGVSGVLAGTLGAIATFFTVVLLTAYFIVDGENVFRWSMSLLPEGTRARLEPSLCSAAARMRRWLVGQALLMLILGCTSAIVFGALRLRYFYVLAVIAGVTNIIPVLGMVVTLILASSVAAIDSWGKLLGVGVFFAAYAQVENAWLTPRIMQSKVNISGTAVLVALLIGAELAGPVGALVSVPSAVLASVLIEEYVIGARRQEIAATPHS